PRPDRAERDSDVWEPDRAVRDALPDRPVCPAGGAAVRPVRAGWVEGGRGRREAAGDRRHGDAATRPRVDAGGWGGVPGGRGPPAAPGPWRRAPASRPDVATARAAPLARTLVPPA